MKMPNTIHKSHDCLQSFSILLRQHETVLMNNHLAAENISERFFCQQKTELGTCTN